LVDRSIVLAGVVVVAKLDTSYICARESDYEFLGSAEAVVELLEALALAYSYHNNVSACHSPTHVIAMD